MRNQILRAVVIGLHVAAAVTAAGCQPSLGVVCGKGWCSDKEICVSPQAAQPACVRNTCGNGQMELGEECDDGTNTGGDGCSPNCMDEVCGNGRPEFGESCDDGNTMGGDGCSRRCTIEECGNAILDREAGEQCDDENTIDGDGCTAGCKLPSCGNGAVDPYEQCDDGNIMDGDACSVNCTIEICGNAILDRAIREECDDENFVEGDGCTAHCELPSCGNRVVDPYEQCDDGNKIEGDGCSASCTIEVCSNGILDRAAGEECDDHNTIDSDGCEADCMLPSCGNGILDPYEQCDDGNTTIGDGCSARCTREICGNGILDPTERCDDGNLTSRDGCSAGCTFERPGKRIGLLAYTKASNTDAFDQFGYSVALSSDGSTLAVGAIGESSAATGIGGNQTGNSASDAGAVYVFTRSGTTWSQQAYIKASNTDAGDQFGTIVALSADGSTLAVGAERESSAATGIGGNENDNSASVAGAVYVFTRSGAMWSQQAYIKASNTDALDLFGVSLALSANGSTLAVGAPGESSATTGIDGNQGDNSARDAGAVYVFTRSGPTWSQRAYIKASNTGAGDSFGDSVALSANGSTLAVGASGESSAATGIGGNQADNSADQAGAVYLFRLSGATWSQQAYIKASNTGTGDGFGVSVALSANGSILAVGAVGESSAATDVGGNQADDSAPQAGAVYVFTRSDATWSQQAYVKASNTEAGDQFGSSVALSADGSSLAVGAAFEDSMATGIGGNQADNSAPFAGAVYTLMRSGAMWSQQAYIKAPNTDDIDRSGWSVTLSADGSNLAIGAWGESSAATGVGGNQTDNSASSAGAVYMYY